MNPNKHYILKLNAKNKDEALAALERMTQTIESLSTREHEPIRLNIIAWKDDETRWLETETPPTR